MVVFDEVARLVKAELRGEAATSALTPQTRLADLGLSSLQISEILFSLEESLGVEIDTAKAAQVQTLGEIAALLDASRGDADGGPT